jgi:hypothetical protein
MIELRTQIHALLKSLTDHVYHINAPDQAVFPYIVYTMQTSDNGEFTELITLDIDGWDNTADETQLETMMQTVNDGLNKKVISMDDWAVVFYNESKLELTDEDPRIKRRKYSYSGKIFK